MEPRVRYFQQGRVFADGPDEAAMAVREMWGNGRLSLKCVEPKMGWHEYLIEIGAYNREGKGLGREK